MQRGDKLITDKKITEADYTNKDVTSAPDRLTGTAQENKYVFDRAVKEVVQPKYNALIDELDTELGKRIQSDDILKMRLDENGVVEYSANGTTYTRMIGRPGVKEDGTPATGAEIFNNHPGNEASGSYSHAEGKGANATGVSSHAEGDSTTASGKSSHAEGTSTNASGEHSHAEGYGASAEGQYSHAEGLSTTSSGKQSHAEGCFSEATGDNSHAQGRETVASGMYSHAQGYHTTAAGDGSHAEGYRATNGKSIAYGKGSHIEGIDTVAGSYYSNGLDIAAHAEGKDTIASSIAAHSEGNGTAARGIGSHAEGGGTAATGSSAHAEGNETTASGDRSHAEGWKTTASGEASHAGGYYTIASADYQFAIGKYNKESTDAAVIVGNGTSTTARSNALELDWEGNLKLAGDVTFAGNRLLSDELANLTLPIAGDELGGVKNGGSVVVKADGTMDAPTGGSKDGTIKASDLICASCDTGTWVSYPSGGGPSLGHESYVLKFTYYESDRGYPSLLPIRFEAPTDGNSDLRFEIQGKVIYINGSSSNIASEDLIIPTLENGDAVPDGYINEGCIVIVTLDLQTLAVKIVDTGIVPVGTVGMINNRLPDKNGVVILSTDDVGAAAADHTHTAATTSAAGFISAEDKTKLDGIAAGANNYTHPATHPSSMITGLGGAAAKEVGTTAGTVAAGDHTHTPASIGAAASSHTHTAATTSTAGFLSASDKTKLNGIATGANNYVLPVAGTALGGVKNGGNVTINEDGTMTAPEGGGDVSSVNGKTGAVTLTAADVGALSKTVQTVTDWNDASTGLYQSGGDAANAPDSASGSSSGECRGLIIDKAQFVMRNNYFNRDSWAGFRYYMGGGTFSEWFPFTASAAGLTAATIADWNTAYKTGFYYARNASNAPASNAHIFAWVISAESAYSGVQLAWKFGSPTALYARSFTVRDWDLEEFYFDTWELLLGGTTTLE